MEQNRVIHVVKSYPKAFKFMDATPIDENFTKNASKTGALYDYETQEWGEVATVSAQNFIAPSGEGSPNSQSFADRVSVLRFQLKGQ